MIRLMMRMMMGMMRGHVKGSSSRGSWVGKSGIPESPCNRCPHVTGSCMMRMRCLLLLLRLEAIRIEQVLLPIRRLIVIVHHCIRDLGQRCRSLSAATTDAAGDVSMTGS